MPYQFGIPFTHKEMEIRKHIIDCIIKFDDVNIGQIKRYVHDRVYNSWDNQILWVLWKTIAVEDLKWDGVDKKRQKIHFYKGEAGPTEVRFRLVGRTPKNTVQGGEP